MLCKEAEGANPIDDKEKLQNTVILGLSNPPSDADITERFTMARSHLRTAAFPEHLRPIWEALQRYFILTGAIIDESDLTTALKGNGMTEAKAFEYAALYRKYREATQHVTTPKFKFAVVRLLEEIKKEKLTQTLTDAAQVLMEGKDIDGKHYFGYSDARKVMAVSTTELERISGTLPEALLQASTGAMWDEYLSVKGGKSHAGLLTGFDFVDKATLGFSPGELIMLGAYTSEGKTTLLENICYDVAFNQGKNVVVATAESTERQVRRRIACLHSRRSAKFTHKGLEYKAVKSGMLSLDEEEHYKIVLEDIRTGGYGKIQVFQLPHKATVSYIVDRLVSYQVLFNVDFFALDYLNLVHAERRRVEKREEIDDVIVEMKQVAVSFDGRGIPVVTPWQIKQSVWVDAKKPGRYTLACLSNSSEAEKSCDVCWTIIRREGDLKTLNSQILKNRDGERREDPVELQAEWNYGYIYQKDDQTDYTKGLGQG